MIQQMNLEMTIEWANMLNLEHHDLFLFYLYV